MAIRRLDKLPSSNEESDPMDRQFIGGGDRCRLDFGDIQCRRLAGSRLSKTVLSE
jgi:hypothetical protein